MKHFILTLFSVACWALPAHAATTTVPDNIVQKSLDAMNINPTLWRDGAIAISSRTELDYTARDQGIDAGAPHTTNGTEVLAFDMATDRAIFEYRQTRADGSIRWRREDYRNNDELFIVNLDARRAGHVKGAQFVRERRGVMRRLPQLLLQEIIDNPELASSSTSIRVDEGDVEFTIDYCPPEQNCLRLGFDPETLLLVKINTRIDYPSRGDTQIEWRYSNYQSFDGIGKLPTTIQHFIGEARYFKADVEQVNISGPDKAPFALPADIRAPKRAFSVPENESEWETKVTEIAPGIFLAENIRPSLNVFFADMGDSILVYDAPAGFPIIELIPPAQLVPGATSNSITLRMLKVIKDTIPGKPIRHAVISHHHSDHIGGLRALMGAKADMDILLPVGSAALASRMENNAYKIAGDAPKGPITAHIKEVRNRRVITGTNKEAVIIPLMDAPHARHMLVVWYPEEKVLFTGDLFYPAPEGRFPAQDRLPIMRYFVDWLDQQGLKPDFVLSSHGIGFGTPMQLEVIRQTEQTP